MNLRTIVLLISFPLMISCVEDESAIPEENHLELMSEIVALSESVSCVDSENWAYTAIGSKPCGGPTGFLAYSTDLDTEYFLNRVEAHRIAEMNYNIRLGLVSDCSTPSQPTSIECSNGKPVLVY